MSFDVIFSLEKQSVSELYAYIKVKIERNKDRETEGREGKRETQAEMI